MKAWYSRVRYPPWVIMQGQKPGFFTDFEHWSLWVWEKGYGILTTQDPLCISSCCSEPPELSFWTLFLCWQPIWQDLIMRPLRFWVPTSWTWSASNAFGKPEKKLTHIPKKKRFLDVEIDPFKGVNSWRCFWWAVELLVANTWRAWHWWVSQPCWQLVRHWTTGKTWAWKVALLNGKSRVFIVFDVSRGDSLDIDARCMQWPWWKADCHRYGSHRGLLSMFCFASCQSDMFFSKKIVHLLLLLLWSFFQVCYFYFLTIRLQASSFPHTSLLITGIRYSYIYNYIYISIQVGVQSTTWKLNQWQCTNQW